VGAKCEGRVIEACGAMLYLVAWRRAAPREARAAHAEPDGAGQRVVRGVEADDAVREHLWEQEEGRGGEHVRMRRDEVA